MMAVSCKVDISSKAIKVTYALIICLLFFSAGYTMAATAVCRPLLWPSKSPINNPSLSIPQSNTVELQAWSDKFIRQPAHPIAVLSSSGRINIKDSTLIASRKSVEDADKAAVLALTYRLTRNVDYLNKARTILTSWASINNPTGNPIDETRLDGMIWAYDLIACDLPATDKALIIRWFEQIRAMKIAWTFGPITSTNNYRIHQLKMLLLLDKVLLHNQDWVNDKISADTFSTINLDPESGMSIDYLQRSALYYQNYVMQPWLEISLITGCCSQAIKRGFTFLSDKILSHETTNEFSDSSANIDALRAKGGFSYAVKGGSFKVTKAAPTIVAYYSIEKIRINPSLWAILQRTKPSPKMAFLNARRLLWQ